MAFNLEQHLKHHAHIFKKYRDFTEGNLHFTFSFLDLQFLEKDVEKTMETLLQKLRLPTSYKVANGTRVNKHGDTVQKFTNRKIDLASNIIAEAIHLKGPNGEDTMPHIHFILKSDARLGRRYSLLKKHIIAIAKEYDLIPHFDELIEHNPKAVINLGRATKKLSWSWKRMTNDGLRIDIQKYGVENAITLLSDYALKTNNLTYYIKTLEGLKKRLNSIRLDVTYENHNLRHTYPIPLTSDDIKVIELIKAKKVSQEDIAPYLKSPILRDFIRYSAKTTTAYIIKALKEQTTLMDGIRRNTTLVQNYIQLISTTPKETKSTYQSKDPIKDKKLSLLLREDLLSIVASSVNEKTLREGMHIAGYFKFGLKKKKGRIVGCFYTELGKKKSIEFIDIGIDWSSIKQTLMQNAQKKRLGEVLVAQKVEKQHVSSDSAELPTPQKMKTVVDITFKQEEVAKRKEQEKLRIKIKRMADDARRQLKKDVERATRFAEETIQQYNKKIQLLERRISDTRNRIQNLTTKSKIDNNSHRELENARAATQGRRELLEASIAGVENDITREESLHETIRDRFTRAIEPINARIRGLRDSIATVKRKISNKVNNSFRPKM